MNSPREQIRYWKNQFRVLKSWRFYFAPKAEYKGQCHYNSRAKTCTIYDLPSYNGKKGMPEDYILHEILHTAWKHVKIQKKYKDRRNAEEMVVQDLCKIMSEKGALKKTLKEIKDI